MKLAVLVFFISLKALAWQDFRVIECPSEKGLEAQKINLDEKSKGFKERKLKNDCIKFLIKRKS